MRSLALRVSLIGFLLACVAVACGGEVEGAIDSSDDDHVDGGAGGSTTVERSPDASVRDAATKFDAAVCVDIDASSFERSCGGDDDCINITAGEICSPNTCWCGGTAISASEQEHYTQAIAPVTGQPPTCSCPYLGRARCIESQCVYCPAYEKGPPGCPDAG